MGRTAPRSDGRSECVSEPARVTGEKATELVGVLGGGAGTVVRGLTEDPWTENGTWTNRQRYKLQVTTTATRGLSGQRQRPEGG